MVERLHRKRRGLVLPQLLHSVIRDARAHLNQAVKAPSSLPQTGPAVCIKRYVDQTRTNFLTLIWIKTESSQRVRPVAVYQYVCMPEQLFKSLVA